MGTPPPIPVFNADPPQTRPKRILWKWSLAATAALVAFLAWQCGSALYQGRELANAAVREFHDRLNGGQYEEIYETADNGFAQEGNREDLVKLLTAVHTKLGNTRTESLTNLRVNATNSGTFLITVYSTEFERGSAVETFTWVKSNGVVKLYGYNVNSTALILN